MASPVVAVDFDGTLADSNMEPLPGAIDWLTSLLAAGFQPVVLSCRAERVSGRVWIEEWLCRHGPFGSVRATDVKPDAVCFVDDRGWNPVSEGRFPTVEELRARGREPVRAAAAATRLPH